ncbi:hypothetical protein DFH08DRAFT_1071744 [Mycena albidolilacea]|uniref:DUF6534 domain-containing protein n=1 Tax=Mycena albidolilacea TaxID=1033008 RepID=A0AAD7ARG9_9AGAR|nr:hypothetical protein DFH08DRAFT_1071744 [Mycena albidolilacea]
MSLPSLDTVTGCLLIGTWASSLLYMFEITRSWYYFQNFRQDDWRFKTLVTITLVLDTLGIVGDYICVYLYTITHAGDAEYLDDVHWPIPFYVLCTSVLAVLVQVFLVFRYWRFTQNTLIALVLTLGIIISLGGGVTTAWMLTLYSSFADRPKLKIPVAFWLVTEFAVDTSIAAVLLWKFRKARGILTETRSTLDRLTAITIQSGAAAATLAGTTLIAYYINPETNVPVGVLYPLRRVYVITLLSNLNVRKSAKSFSTTGTSSGREATGGERELPIFTCWATDDSCAIHVHRTVRTSVRVIGDPDPRPARPPGTLKTSFRSAPDDSCPEEIEMMANHSSKKQSTSATA